MKTCLTCEGRKKVKGIGMMTADCHVCKGKGYVVVDVKGTFDDALNAPKPILKEKQKAKSDAE